MRKTNVAFLWDGDIAADDPILYRVFAAEQKARLARCADVYVHVVSATTLSDHAERMGDVEVVFSTWGMPRLTPDPIRFEHCHADS